MAALGTAIQVATECCRATTLDGIKNTQMEPRQPGPVLCDETAAVLSDDVGHLEGWPVHRFCSFRERLMLSGLDTVIVSSGLATADRCLCERWRDQCVFELGMTQQYLNRAQIGTGLEQVGGIAVPQSVRRDMFADAGPLGGFPIGFPGRLGGDGDVRPPVLHSAGEQICLWV